MASNLTAFNCSIAEDGPPPLLSTPDELIQTSFFAAMAVLILWFFSSIQPIALAAKVAVSANGAPAFSHHNPRTDDWTPYSDHLSDLIAEAQQRQPAGGTLQLPDLPFEVRWGSEATSWRMHQAPRSAMIQVNTTTFATRVVRAEDTNVTADVFEARWFGCTHHFPTVCWGWLRYLDNPWVAAEFEGESFENFVLALILESVLNFTSTANTFLEGDLEFANDPAGVVITGSWLLSVMDLLVRSIHAPPWISSYAPSTPHYGSPRTLHPRPTMGLLVRSIHDPPWISSYAPFTPHHGCPRTLHPRPTMDLHVRSIHAPPWISGVARVLARTPPAHTRCAPRRVPHKLQPYRATRRTLRPSPNLFRPLRALRRVPLGGSRSPFWWASCDERAACAAAASARTRPGKSTCGRSSPSSSSPSSH